MSQRWRACGRPAACRSLRSLPLNARAGFLLLSVWHHRRGLGSLRSRRHCTLHRHRNGSAGLRPRCQLPRVSTTRLLLAPHSTTIPAHFHDHRRRSVTPEAAPLRTTRTKGTTQPTATARGLYKASQDKATASAKKPRSIKTAKHEPTYLRPHIAAKGSSHSKAHKRSGPAFASPQFLESSTPSAPLYRRHRSH